MAFSTHRFVDALGISNYYWKTIEKEISLAWRLLRKHNQLNNISIYFAYRKISAHEFEKGGLLKPIVNTIDGTPTFLSVGTHSHEMASNANPINSTSSHPHRPQRLSRNELKHLDEKQLIFELVRY